MQPATIILAAISSLPLILAAPTDFNSTTPTNTTLTTRWTTDCGDQLNFYESCIPSGQFQAFDQPSFGGNRHIFQLQPEVLGQCQLVRTYWYDHQDAIESVALGYGTKCDFYSKENCKGDKGTVPYNGAAKFRSAMSMKITRQGSLQGGWLTKHLNGRVKSFKCSLGA